MNEDEAAPSASNLNDGSSVNNEAFGTRSQTPTGSDHQGSVQEDEIQCVGAREPVSTVDESLSAPPPDGGIHAWTQVLVVSPRICELECHFNEWFCRSPQIVGKLHSSPSASSSKLYQHVLAFVTQKLTDLPRAIS
jgi:hypothetical protein